MAILVVVLCMWVVMAILISDHDSSQGGDRPEQAERKRSDDMDTLPAIMAGSLPIP